MSRLIYLFVFFCAFTVAAQQATVSSPNLYGIGGNTVLVPVNVTGLDGIGAIGLKIQYDPAVLTWVGAANVSSLIPGASVNANSGVITIAWDGLDGMSTLAAKLLDLHFTYISGTSAIDYLEAQCELSDMNGNPITAAFTDGSVSQDPAHIVPATVSSPDVYGIGGNTVLVPVNVTEFNSIGAIGLKIQYDPAVLTWVGAANVSTLIPGASVSADNGVITVAWSGLSGISTPAAKLLDLQFTYISGTSTIDYLDAQCELSDMNGNPVAATFTDGSVAQDPAHIVPATVSSPDVYGIGGNTVLVPVNVTEFNSIGAIGLKIQYDPAVLTWVGAANVSTLIPGASVSADNGVITVAWSGLSGISTPAAKLLDLQFTYISGTSAINYLDAQCVLSDMNGNPVPAVYSDGSVAPDPTPVVRAAVSSPSLYGVRGNTILVPVWAANFNGIGAITLKIQYDPAVLTWVGAANVSSLIPGASANAINGVVTIAWDAVNGMSTLAAKLLDLKFTYISGTSAINYLDAQCELSDLDGYPITVIYTDGSVTPYPVPGVPVLISPADNAATQPINLTFTWNSDTLATSFRLQVATDSAFTALAYNDSTITGTSKQVTGLLNSTLYYWRVRAKNVGGSGAFSNARSFTTIYATVVPPTLGTPANNAVNQPLNPSLTWGSVNGAATYRLQVSTNSTFTNIIFDDATLTGTSKQLSGLTNLTQYFWRVSATNIGGTSAYSEVWYFTTIVPNAAVPVLASPTQNAVNQPITQTFTWNASTHAATYRLQISTNNTFTNIVYNDSTLTGTTKQVTGLLNSTQYFWRVNAKNAAGTTAYSEVRNFTTIIAHATVPVLVSPGNNAVNQPINPALTWNASTHAATYRLQVSTNNSFTNIVYNDSTLTGTTKQVSGLLNSTQYFWRVNAKNAAGTTAYSEVWSFTTIVADAPAPILVSPGNNAVNLPNNPTVTWNASANAATYHLQVASDSAFTTLVFTDSTLADTTKQVTGLLNGTNYFWRVNAKNAAGSSSWSSAWNFTTSAGFSLSGTVKYRNSSLTRLAGANVDLMHSGSVLDTEIADSTGTFAFPLVLPGTYPLSVRHTAPWGGVNATDALLIRRYVAGFQTFDSLQVKAADVNRSTTVNATDALLVRRRVAGFDTTFVRGNWAFEAPAVTITDSARVQNILGLCVGDVNGSNAPGVQKAAPTINFIAEGTLGIQEGNDFSIPIYLSSRQIVGAVTLMFEYSEESLDIKGVTSKMEGMLFSAKDGILTIVWDDIEGAAFTENEPLLTIAASLKKENTSDIKIQLLPEFSEFADINANILSAITVTMPELGLFVPTEFSLSQNFPNPFNPSTKIQYDIPANAHVRVEIFNALGQSVEVLADAVQAPGRYTVEWNAKNFTTGVYFYRLTAESETKNYTQVKKLLLVK